MSGIPAGAGSLIGKRLGKYEILALLALGGTAEIYLARIGGAAGFEKYVVVKCLHDHLADDTDFVKMFLDEARMAAMLDHSNIVQTFELGEYTNRYYMVMEFLAGLSLAMVVRRAQERLQGGMLPVPLILNVAAQACAGLHYAHERSASGKPLNMVHRDISPQNLVISFEGVVKVVDFGIARAELRETKTKAGTIKGKFAYMSPEQCVAANVDRRTDVFALGVIVHELLVGRRLFKRNSPYETYQAVIECAVEPPSRINNTLDPALDEVVMRAVAKDKDKRYPTAEAFGDAMLGYLHHRGKASGGGELGRFFEQYFAQEIEEHGERMRELIAGRPASVEGASGWDDADEQANQTVDLSRRKAEEQSISLATGEIMELNTGDASLDAFVGDLEEENDPDALPADKTNIVHNPLEMIEQLNAQVARNTGKTPVPPGSITASGIAPLPAPPTGPKGAVGKPGSGRFPDMPNMPTQLAPETKLEHAPTAIGAAVNPMGHTQAEMQAQPAHFDPNVAPAGPMSSTHYAVRPSQMQGAQQPNLGATAPAPALQGHPHGPMQGHASAPMPAHAPVLNDYPVMPGGQRPFSSDLAPSNLSSSPQQRPSYGNAPLDPQAAANLMSPVGGGYPQTDWERAAGVSAKALPTWLLLALFGGALLGALLLTLMIAKIFS
ncbi:MAG TPA: protein kinase [Kofleriaceae bacterium]|nr:protein kinase [Kofleriaceae bacterium]